MSDNKEKLQDALGMLDDDLLLEVEKLRRMPQKNEVNAVSCRRRRRAIQMAR